MEEKDVEKKEQSQDKEVETEESVPKKSFDGIKADLIQTRQEKQMVSNQLQQTQDEMRELRERVRQFETKKESEEMDALLGNDPDEPITASRLKQAWATLQQKEAQKKEQSEYQEKLVNFRESVNKMRLETQDKTKFGLDWDTLQPIINRLYASKTAINKNWERALLYESNPAKELYEMALKEPEIQERVKIMQNEPVLNGMENRKTDKGAVEGSSSPKPGKKLTLAQVAQMTPAETIKHKKEIEELLRENAKSMKR